MYHHGSNGGCRGETEPPLGWREEVELAIWREAMNGAMAMRYREEQEDELASRRGEFELLRDKLAAGLMLAFALVLFAMVVISLFRQPELIPGTTVGSILLLALRSLPWQGPGAESRACDRRRRDEG